MLTRFLDVKQQTVRKSFCGTDQTKNFALRVVSGGLASELIKIFLPNATESEGGG
jgi:hypothetical protein